MLLPLIYLKHPRKFLRTRKMLFDIAKVRNRGGVVSIADNAQLSEVRISSKGYNNRVAIGNNTHICGLSLCFLGDGGELIIEDDVCVNAKAKAMIIFISSGHSVRMCRGGLFSDSIHITTTDFHKVYDINTNILQNPEGDIVIGENCWIGRNVNINKGVSIAPNCVIAHSSVVTKSIKEEHVLIAGVPAKVVKRNIEWTY